MTTELPVREKLFDAMGYDWIRRSIKSQGAMCCTPMGELYQLAVKVLQEEGISEKDANDKIAHVWSMPDPVALCRPLGNVKSLFSTIKDMNFKIGVCTTDNRSKLEATM